MAAETPPKVSEKQALADAERLAGAPKASPKCSSKTRTPQETPLKRPAARRDEHQRKTVKQAKTLKRPASNNDSTEVAGPSVEPSKVTRKRIKAQTRLRRRTRRRHRSLKSKSRRKRHLTLVWKPAPRLRTEPKKLETTLKPATFTETFPSCRRRPNHLCPCLVSSKSFPKISVLFFCIMCVAGAESFPRERFEPREEDSVGKPSRTERFQRLLHLQLGMSGCENAVYLQGENQRFPEGSRYAQVFDDFEAWFRTSFAEGYGGWWSVSNHASWPCLLRLQHNRVDKKHRGCKQHSGWERNGGFWRCFQVYECVREQFPS